ncbi:GH116 family glycosyl hydrolase [Bacteroidota bacterium]
MKTKLTLLLFCSILIACTSNNRNSSGHVFNGPYSGEYLNRIAFPLGGIGAGMVCIDGNGAFSHLSVRHTPDVFNTPFMFGAVSLKGVEDGAKVLEGPVQSWKIFGNPRTGNGSNVYGVPRFEEAVFNTRFPFCEVLLKEKGYPLDVRIQGWSPFIPTDEDNSSLPVGGVEYTFSNTTGEEQDALFSFNSENIMRVEMPSEWGGRYVGNDSIRGMAKGFIMDQLCLPEHPEYKGEFAIFTDEEEVLVDHCWFRGGWYDAKTVLWKNMQQLSPASNPVTEGATGASINVPFTLGPGESKTIKVYISWHVPHSDLRTGWMNSAEEQRKLTDYTESVSGPSCCVTGDSPYYEPWYYSRFFDVKEVADYWLENYKELKAKSALFSTAFFESELPAEVLEAVAANLTILKSPTVLRQKDGTLWAWEGCHDLGGCCAGTCTHVWNYAQAIPHLFPVLERSIRETEFKIDQNEEGHQTFRSYLPVRQPDHNFYAAADGQLGGIMKMAREWKVSGNTKWLKEHFPMVRSSLDYCIRQWDPRHTGALEEPHHNTYDIEFWGADGMCTSFYLGALAAAVQMADALGEEVPLYSELLEKGIQRMETELYNGEYFIQKVQWEGLDAPNPVEASQISMGGHYTPEALAILEQEGPKYQYGNGCISDGVLGFWLAEMCGIDVGIDYEKVISHLSSVHKYNLRSDLSDHVNPQRASFAYGEEGGLLLCSWPNYDEPTFPFVYSNEVWTGIEYQVASHLMLSGEIEKGLEIVRELRKRYDGRIRNPFNEYECGHWYARAMASYGLLQGLTGIRYDAVEKTMYIDSRLGDSFSAFFSCEAGFGKAGLDKGKPFVEPVMGSIEIESFIVDGKLYE